MSNEPIQDERPLLVRTFEAIEVAADGRNLEILCVPFNTPARVADPPDFVPYDEEFLFGSMAGATKAPHRVLLDFEHQTSMSGVLGHAQELEERDDALYGRFRVTEHPDGDKALSLVREKVLTGASVMFKPLRSVRSAAGVVQRVKVHLDRLSLCRVGAYEAAQVLAVRSQDVIGDAVEEIPPFDPELAEQLVALGLTVPDSLRAA